MYLQLAARPIQDRMHPQTCLLNSTGRDISERELIPRGPIAAPFSDYVYSKKRNIDVHVMIP